MSHLTLETLARLLDDAPDPTESGHLDICEQCRAELEALRADASAMRALPDPEPPIAQWIALEHRLKAEGLMRATSWTTTIVRMAAVLAIFVLGSVVGGLVMRQQQGTPYALVTPTTAVPAQTFAPAPARAETIYVPPTATLASAPTTSAVATRPAATAEEAVARLRDAERGYLAALNRYSDFNARADNAEPLARLAALESIVATTRAALGQAPADPVINGYHLTAVAQRDATLRQLAASGQTWY